MVTGLHFNAESRCVSEESSPDRAFRDLYWLPGCLLPSSSELLNTIQINQRLGRDKLIRNEHLHGHRYSPNMSDQSNHGSMSFNQTCLAKCQNGASTVSRDPSGSPDRESDQNPETACPNRLTKMCFLNLGRIIYRQSNERLDKKQQVKLETRHWMK